MKLKYNIKVYSAILTLSIILFSCKDDEEALTPTNNTVITETSSCLDFVKSTSSYDTITGGVEINRSNSDDYYAIALGFSFKFCDRTFDTLFISEWDYSSTFTYTVNNGFTDARQYELSPTGSLDLEQKWDTNTSNYVSMLKFKTTGTPGERISTIEFRDFEHVNITGQGTRAFTINCKMIFFEKDNRIRFEYGPNNVTKNFANDPFLPLNVGLYASSINEGIFLTGDPNSPGTASGINAANSELIIWPPENTVYTFTQQ